MKRQLLNHFTRRAHYETLKVLGACSRSAAITRSDTGHPVIKTCPVRNDTETPQTATGEPDGVMKRYWEAST